jgi:hypothetical protein
MKICMTVKIFLNSFLTSVINYGLVSFTFRPLFLRGESHQYTSDRWLVEKINICPAWSGASSAARPISLCPRSRD